jgi:glycosyltransferase involved in cell wall biosynthesis
MAAGVPVVTTPVVGNAEIVDGGRAGVLVAEHDVPALTTALRALLHDAPRRAELARAGHRRVHELFDLEKNVATLRAWFAEESKVAGDDSAGIRPRNRS